jgi:glycerol-3-phosphate dehydrogenase
VTALRREEGVWTIEAGGERFCATTVVNAVGPSVLDLLDRAHRPTDVHMRQVRGAHIVVPRLFDHVDAYFLQLPDGRIFFALPYEGDFTLIGTTDADHQGPLTDVRASEAEIAYLCAAANRYFAQAISPADVVWSFAGVRPLIDDGSARPEAATRGYRLELEDGLLTVFGGKITTYRHLAEQAVRTLAPLLPVLDGPGWTACAPLPGGDFPMTGLADLIAGLTRDHPFLDARAADRVGRAYGTRARAWLNAPQGIDFGHGLSEAEVRYLVDQEWARDVDDILWRRTKLGLRFDPAQRARLKDWLAERA